MLTIISHMMEKLVAQNEWLAKSLEPFYGLRAPIISIAKYLERIYKYTKCSPACFVVGHYTNEFYARVAGVSNRDLNKMELELLFLLEGLQLLRVILFTI
ncbi:PREDICTED: cyclin-U1-1 [Brassica oleracea var. oleracea]|uniref:Uncharacterized protein n=2 Tax=Brassica oleracea TaxID=3712 RepID=A0A0D3ABP5_BRAOL|nr:PREDICTED: cyclin-U1-1 [Brassica oleracea var. oleracea]VDD51800.1 unnamed protein product [Brassica oleracea]